MNTGRRPEIRCLLTRGVIDSTELIRGVADSQAGAIGLFLGVVRAEHRSTDSVPLRGLEYTAYESMALADLESISQEAAGELGLLHVYVVHRLGRLRVGEVSVAVVVSSPHRAESFAGCRAIIDRLKKTTPIFKQELWEDGAASWVEPGGSS